MKLLNVYFAVFACVGMLCPPNRGVFLTFALVSLLLASLLAQCCCAVSVSNRNMFLVSIKFLSKHLLGFYHKYSTLIGYATHYLFCDR